LETRLVDQLIENAVIDYPEVLVEDEIRSMFQSLLHNLEHRKTSYTDYLSQIGKTQEELIEEYKTESETRVRRGLVLGEVTRLESIKVEDADLDAEIAARAAENHTTPEAVRAYLDAQNQVDAVRQSLHVKKVLGFLVSSAIITEKKHDLDEDPQAEEAAE
jgi:trigger factor